MKLVKVFIILILIVFRLAFILISDKVIPVNPTEVDLKETAQSVISGKSVFNLYYALYPHFVSPLLLFFEDEKGIYAMRILSSLFGIALIVISFLLTKNFWLSIFICFQPMNVVLSSMAKPEIFVFALTLFSYILLLKYKETGDVNYINIGALLSSACILLKYYVPTFISYILCSLFLLAKRDKRYISRFLIYVFIPFLAFLPFIIYYNIDFLKVILGYYKAYKPPNPHSQYLPLEGEKSLGSVIFSVSSSFLLLSPYSLVITVISLLFAIGRNFWLTLVYFLISFFTLFFAWPYFRFLHQYYPITAPLVFGLADGAKRNKEIFPILFITLIFVVVKYRNYNFDWINSLNLDQGKYLFIIPLSHAEMKVRFEKSEKNFDFLVYDLVDQKSIQLAFQKIRSGEYRKIFLDVIHESLEGADVHKKALVNYFRKSILNQGFVATDKIDSLEIISKELDPFEKMMFPVFKNLLFNFKFEVYEKK